MILREPFWSFGLGIYSIINFGRLKQKSRPGRSATHITNMVFLDL